MGITSETASQREEQYRSIAMSEWMILDVTGITKTTGEKKILQKFKDAKVSCCRIQIFESKEERGGKRCLSCTVHRGDWEREDNDLDPGAWIFKEDDAAKPEGGEPLKPEDFK